MPQSSSNQNQVLDLLFHLYLFGRKMKQLAKQHQPERSQDQLLELGILSSVAIQPRSVSELAELLSTGLSAMSERVKNLKNQGLVDPIAGSDNREMRCQLTPAGRILINQTKTRIEPTCLQLTNQLTPTEITQLTHLIKKLVTAIPTNV